MKTLSLAKVSWTFLLLSLPLNFLVFSGIGNIYLTTILIFLNFVCILFLSGGRLLTNKYAIWALLLFATLCLTSALNVLFGSGIAAKEQLVFSIIYLQLILAFILGAYLFNRLEKLFIFNTLMLIIFLFSLRLFIDDIDRVFNLSAVRGLRVESLFAGGVNNFGLIVGIGFLINFFHSKKGLKRTLLGLYFLLVIIFTMSRGALFGLVFTLFITALFDTNRKTLVMLLKIAMFLVLTVVFLSLFIDEFQIYLEKFSERFLSIFTGDTTLKQASSGRELILGDLYENHIKQSSLFHWLFGHGFGSINFSVNGYPYESSHNIIIDIFFRNGLLTLIFLLIFIISILIDFLKHRNTEDLGIFAIFIFLHFELLVNPFVYAAQTGWIYTLLLALFIYRNRLSKNVKQRIT